MIIVTVLFLVAAALFIFSQLLGHDATIINLVATGEADITALDEKYLPFEDATILALNQPIAIALVACLAIIAILVAIGVALWIKTKVRVRSWLR